MKKLLYILALSFFAFADTKSELKNTYNNISHEYAYCASYFVLAVESLKSRGDSKDLIISMQKAAELSTDAALNFSKAAGKSKETSIKLFKARYKMALDEMSKEINNDYSNMSILINKYNKKCEMMIKDPETAWKLFF